MTVGIEQTVAPIRFAFLIMPDDNSRFERAVETASAIWGGFYSPILFYFEELPKEFREEYGIGIPTGDYYQNVLENYDPDIILFDEDIPAEKVRDIAGERKVYHIENYIELLKDGNNDYGIDIIEIINSVNDKEFKFQRNDVVKLVIPDCKEGGLFFKTLMGSLNDALVSEIKEALEGKAYFHHPVINFESIGEMDFRRDFHLVKLNAYETSSWPNNRRIKGSALYFIDPDRLYDLMNFWNLRALGWSVAAISANHLNDPYFSKQIDRFTSLAMDKPSGQIVDVTYLTGKLSENQHKTINERLKSFANKEGKRAMYAHQYWYPRIWGSKTIVDADHARSTIVLVNRHYEQVEYQNDRIRFEAKELPFKMNYNPYKLGNYKIILSFSYYDEMAENAGIVSGIKTSDWRRITHPSMFRHWRLSLFGIHHIISSEHETISLGIPKAIDFFRYFFGYRKHGVKITGNNRLSMEVLKNVGGIHGSRFFLNQQALKIVELFEGGKEVRYEELFKEIKKSTAGKNDEVKDFIGRLIDNKIIEMGTVLQCPICNQHSFYLLKSIDQELTCGICRNDFQFPVTQPQEAKWAYRGIGPFARNNKADGIMSVFACLRLFYDEFAEDDGNVSSLIGFELKQNSVKKSTPFEIDLALMLQDKYDTDRAPDLFLCECKIYKHFDAVDMERMKTVGEAFPNAILTFATLNPELTKKEKTMIGELVQHFQRGTGYRPVNPVLILTANELLPKDHSDPFNAYKARIKPFHRYNDWVANICDMTIEKNLEIKTWSAIQNELWDTEMKKRNAEIEQLKLANIKDGKIANLIIKK